MTLFRDLENINNLLEDPAKIKIVRAQAQKNHPRKLTNFVLSTRWAEAISTLLLTLSAIYFWTPISLYNAQINVNMLEDVYAPILLSFLFTVSFRPAQMCRLNQREMLHE